MASAVWEGFRQHVEQSTSKQKQGSLPPSPSPFLYRQADRQHRRCSVPYPTTVPVNSAGGLSLYTSPQQEG